MVSGGNISGHDSTFGRRRRKSLSISAEASPSLSSVVIVVVVVVAVFPSQTPAGANDERKLTMNHAHAAWGAI